MYIVSSAYKDAIIGNPRMAHAKMEWFIDGDNQPPVTFEGDDIIDIICNEDAFQQNETPAGKVCVSDVEVRIRNDNKQFTLTNRTSPFYGKILPNKMIKLYIGMELADGSVEYVPTGTYRSGPWTVDDTGMIASTLCQDILSIIAQYKLPFFTLKNNTTLYDMFVTLFKAVGLTSEDYSIDELLKQVSIPLGWIAGDTVGNTLTFLSVAGLCIVFVGRDSKIHVTQILGTDINNVLDTVDGYSFINEGVVFPQDYSHLYTSIHFNYTIPSAGNSKVICKVDNIDVISGTPLTVTLQFTDAPIWYISQIELLGATNTTYQVVALDPWKIQITFICGAGTDHLNVAVYGVPIVQSTARYIKQGATFTDIERPLEITSYLIQNIDNATAYCDKLLPVINVDKQYIEFPMRGNLAWELGDLIQLNLELPDDPGVTHSYKCILVSVHHTYDGTLSGSARGLLVSSI